MKAQKIVCLDRDGVLCEYREYLSKMEDFHIIPGSLKALKILKDKGYLVFVLTNQPMLGRGMVSAEELNSMHSHLKKEALKNGGEIQEIFFCPHTPPPMKPGYLKEYVTECKCRKPEIGMYQQVQAWMADQGQKPDLEKSWMIGDSWRDILLGKRAGLRTGGILGVPELTHESLSSQPEILAPSLLEVIESRFF